MLYKTHVCFKRFGTVVTFNSRNFHMSFYMSWYQDFTGKCFTANISGSSSFSTNTGPFWCFSLSCSFRSLKLQNFSSQILQHRMPKCLHKCTSKFLALLNTFWHYPHLKISSWLFIPILFLFFSDFLLILTVPTSLKTLNVILGHLITN